MHCLESLDPKSSKEERYQTGLQVVQVGILIEMTHHKFLLRLFIGNFTQPFIFLLLTELSSNS